MIEDNRTMPLPKLSYWIRSFDRQLPYRQNIKSWINLDKISKENDATLDILLIRKLPVKTSS